MVTIRIRSLVWFAAGAAIALIATAVFVGVRTNAAPGPDETTYVPITPCRLFDTRPGTDNVGPRDTPLGPADTHTQQVTGTNGKCTIPNHATGIAMNVTTVAGTDASFLTIWPADATQPLASNLNWTPGQAPTPNKVDVKLGTGGDIKLYNLAGTVHVLADAAGYYTNAGLQDLQTQLDREHVWSARVHTDGTKAGKGPYTTHKFNTGPGHYGVKFDVERIGFPDSQWFTTVASPTCGGYTASVSHGGGASISPDGKLTHVTPNVNIYDAAGNSADCGFSLVMTFDDPNPRFIIVPT